MLDAPVSGGEIGAIAGTLTFMVGGEAAALEEVRAVLSAMGSPEKIVHVGDSGAGQICKAAIRSCWAARCRSSPRRSRCRGRPAWIR